MRAITPFLLLAACGPMDLDVVNETGGELVLNLTTASGDVFEAVVPDGGELVEYSGAPSLNASWTATVTTVGRYVLSQRTVDLVRSEVNVIEYTAFDVNAFAVDVTNTTGARIDSLFFSDASEGAIGDGERPGDNFGPLADGETVTISLPEDRAFNSVFYQGGAATLDNSGQITGTGGSDLTVDL